MSALAQIYDDAYLSASASVSWPVPVVLPYETAALHSIHQADAESDLRATWEECSEKGWDGYSAKPISGMTLLYAQRFLRSLPSELPGPEVSADNDGEVSFEWYGGPRRVFSVSVGSSGDLTYAGLFGDIEKHHGVIRFKDMIPSRVLDLIRSVYFNV